MGKRRSESIPQQKQGSSSSKKRGKRSSESIPQQKQGSSSSKKKMGKRSSESSLQQKQGSSSSKKKMGKRSPDSIMQQKKSSKTKKRELKDLGPTLKELEYGCEPPRLALWMDTDDEEGWKQNRQSYSSDDESLSPEDEADYRRQCGLHSEAGLQYYNKISRTKYEMVEALDQVVFIEDAVWIHCNFTAKPQMKPNGDKDDQAQLFFAEMYVSPDLPKRLIVVKSLLLKDGKTKAGDGCEACGGPRSVITHPPNGGFRRGYNEYDARALRRRSIG